MGDKVVRHRTEFSTIVVKCIACKITDGEVQLFADVAVQSSRQLVPVAVDRYDFFIDHTRQSLDGCLCSYVEVASQEVNRHRKVGFEHEFVVARHVDRLHKLVVLSQFHFLTFLVEHHYEVRLVDDQRVAEVVVATCICYAARECRTGFLVGIDISYLCLMEICRSDIWVSSSYVACTASVHDVLEHVVARILGSAPCLDSQCIILVERKVGYESIERRIV